MVVLPGSLEADQHHDRGWVWLVPDLPLLAPEERDQLLVDDLHDLLARGERLEDVAADRALADPVDEGARDPEVHVGLEQCDANLAQPDLDILLREAAATREAAQGRGKAIAEGFEHRQAVTLTPARRARRSVSTRSRRSSSAAWPSRCS